MMKSTLAKISLLTLLGVGFVGSALAVTKYACPTVAGAITLNNAYQVPDGRWVAIRESPNYEQPNNSLSIWQDVKVIMHDKDITNADEALKRGQKILDTSWWGTPDAIEGSQAPYVYYTCYYDVDKPFSDLNDQVNLYSFLLTAGVNSVNSKTKILPKKAVNQIELPNILRKNK